MLEGESVVIVVGRKEYFVTFYDNIVKMLNLKIKLISKRIGDHYKVKLI